ncbi:MAG: hypothetical protein QXR17_06945 [Candidatus Bathyarchaeia archaeon]
MQVSSSMIASGAIQTSHFASNAVAPDADRVDGYHASQTPSAYTIPVSDFSGKLSIGWIPDAVRNRGFVVFTSSSTWTVPAGVTQILIIAVGAGGGGGGARATGDGTNMAVASAAGGKAGLVDFTVASVSPGSTLTIYVGSGGSGGSGSTASSGGEGGHSSVVRGITVLAHAYGGPGGAGSSASAGQIVVVSSGFAGSAQVGGNGEPCLGPGGQSGWNSSGTYAVGYGSGGGGAHAASTSSSQQSGGNGGRGIVVIIY